MHLRERVLRISGAGVLAASVTAGLVVAPTPAAAVENGRIAFVNARSGNSDIWSMLPDGSDQDQLTTDAAADTDPAPSPDGTKIAFVASRDGNQEIYVMNTNGSNQTRLTSTSDSENDPSFSPDSTKLVFSRATGLFDSNIWTMAADGTNEVQLTFEVETDSTPVFSPDATKIAFVRSSNVWIMAADGANQTQISSGGGSDPAFLPDGRIVFKKSNEVQVMNADGSNLINLTNDPSFDADPSPSPDGTKIAFTTFRNGHFDIYVMNANGTSQTNLTGTSVDDLSPAWGGFDPGLPGTTITPQQSSPTTDTTPSFAFVTDETATFECSLVLQGSTDTFSACTSPFTAPSALSNGTYAFKVRATDLEGNVESPPASVTVTVDTVGPVVTVNGTTPTNDTTPTITFSFDEAVQSGLTQCSLVVSGNPDSFSACSSPFTSGSTLAPGSYVFKANGTDLAGNAGSASSFTFTIDTTAPTVTITGPTLTNDSTPTFSFDFSETVQGGSTQCSLVASGASDSFSACSAPFTPGSALANGAFVFTARGTDLAGNVGTGSQAFTVDTTGPTATITGTTPTSDTTPTITFSFNESVQSGLTRCSLQPSGSPDSFSSCSSPFTASTLAEGTHVFKVEGTDLAGNAGAAASFTFTVDTTGPTATISGPTTTNDRTPTFTFTFNETTLAGSVVCSLQAQGSADSFSACSSPFTSTSLSDGNYTFKARASDALGNVGTTGSHSFTIDGGAPAVSITASPPAVTNDNTPTFSFTTGDATTVQCSLQPSGSPDSFAGCTSPFTGPASADGSYTFKVRGTDAAGNMGEATHSFGIDTVAPVARISGPVLTNDTTPTFTFSFSESVQPGLTQCSLVPSSAADSFTSCALPFTQATALADGVHVLKVKGTDAAGNAGAAASRSFTVDTVGPTTVITGKAKTRDATPTFTFTASEAGSTFQCSMDGKQFAACDSPYTSPKLRRTRHTLQVMATDPARNAGPVAAFTFKIRR